MVCAVHCMSNLAPFRCLRRAGVRCDLTRTLSIRCPGQPEAYNFTTYKIIITRSVKRFFFSIALPSPSPSPSPSHFLPRITIQALQAHSSRSGTDAALPLTRAVCTRTRKQFLAHEHALTVCFFLSSLEDKLNWYLSSLLQYWASCQTIF